MNSEKSEIVTNHLTDNQMKALRKFKGRLSKRLPNFRIEWVKHVKDNMIELHLERDKYIYRTGLQAAKLATEVEDETGVFIILR